MQYVYAFRQFLIYLIDNINDSDVLTLTIRAVLTISPFMLRIERIHFFIIRNQFDACLSIAVVELFSRDAFSFKSFRFILINMQHKIGY